RRTARPPPRRLLAAARPGNPRRPCPHTPRPDRWPPRCPRVARGCARLFRGPARLRCSWVIPSLACPGNRKGPTPDGVGPNQSSGLLSVVVFADDLLSDFLAALGPPLVRGAACPFFGEFAGGQLVASAEHVYCCLAQRVHVECPSSAPFNLEWAIAQYRHGVHVVHPSLCVWVWSA